MACRRGIVNCNSQLFQNRLCQGSAKKIHQTKSQKFLSYYQKLNVIKAVWMIECNEYCRQYDSNRSTLVVKDTSGRLGNAIFSYQVLLALQIGFGTGKMDKVINHLYETKSSKIESLIIKHTGQKPKRDSAGKLIISREDIVKYNIDIDGLVHSNEFTKLEELQIPDSSFPWEIWQKLPLTGLKNDELRIGKAFILYPGTFKISLEDHKMMASVPNMAQELNKDLRIRDTYLNSAQKTILTIIYVGIHSRRTDHLALERVNGYKEIKPSYFIEAMHLFTKHFGDKVIFLYVSDDLDWGIKHLGPRTQKSGNLYFVGEGHGTKEDSIGHDLAVMKSCNHSIITHGTFSYWAGFLSNGIVVLPDHIHQFRTENEMREVFTETTKEKPIKEGKYVTVRSEEDF
ncbi:FUT1_2 [Lepeophtheirus salmonis]|uniref:L-Fucosyltransferase n=1 Tax=Lepeophtheirus salmonis TaxID=72036 RepID=A0A7R8GZF2_LEPSM|nr:FUT1_2 [Lepeophtheirus salmonis]CAF2765054.1 FUT1_2 [Lepeophtheirus salmonis]